MKLLDIATGPWAIEPDKLTEIMSIYDAHLKREKIDLSAVEERIGSPLGRKEQGFDVINGVAVIPVDGVIAKKANMFTKVSGACSTDLLRRDLEDAIDDPSVESILLDVDSPGGAVNGTQELAQAIFESRGTKPIVAYANGCMASAAYWIGAAADEVYSAPTATVGSIGVVTQHVDVSQADKKAGIKRTEIYAGKYKRISTETEPLSDEGRADIQGKVDYLYSIFVGDIAAFRGVSEKTVLADMADGRVFIGEQAVEAGLVDGVSTFDSVLERMASGDLSKNEMKEKAMSKNDVEMTRDALAESHPDLVEAIRKEGYEAGVEDGATAETERVKAVFATSLAGHEALVEAMAFDGKTTGAEAAIKVINAEKEKGSNNLAAMESDAAEVANVSASASDEPVAIGFDDLVKAKMDEGLTRGKAVMAVARDNPEAHANYLKALEA